MMQYTFLSEETDISTWDTGVAGVEEFVGVHLDSVKCSIELLR